MCGGRLTNLSWDFPGISSRIVLETDVSEREWQKVKMLRSA